MSFIYVGDTEMAITIRGVGWHLPDIDLESGQCNERSIAGMAYRATRNCLDDADVSMKDINAVVTASVDLWDGKTASNIAVTEAVGAVMKAETRIAGDGLQALMHGAMMVMSGHYQRVLVVAHGKSSETDLDKVSNWSYDPVYQQTLNACDSQSLGLQNQAIKARMGEASDIRSPLDSIPLDQLAPQGDGACAVILEEGGKGIKLEGFGYDLDAHYLGDRTLERLDGLKRAFGRACSIAGLPESGNKIKAFYWSLSTTLQLPLLAEATGVCSFKEGFSVLPDKKHHIQWQGLPPFAAGLQRLISAVLDLRANPEQGRSLVHGCHGPAGQSQAICLLNKAGDA